MLKQGNAQYNKPGCLIRWHEVLLCFLTFILSFFSVWMDRRLDVASTSLGSSVSASSVPKDWRVCAVFFTIRAKPSMAYRHKTNQCWILLHQCNTTPVTQQRYPNTIHTNGWVCNKEKTSTYTTNKCTVLKHSSHRSMGMCWKSITDYLKASPQMEWEERQFICWRWRPTSSWRTRFF